MAQSMTAQTDQNVSGVAITLYFRFVTFGFMLGCVVLFGLVLRYFLPQMVAPNLKEYAAILDQFLEKPKHLARLRAATRVARDESPLFDTQLWVDYLDVALTMAWESRAAQRAACIRTG